MASQIQHGYLVLADISGFTSFLAKTELEHAHDILSELLELVVAHLTPPFTLVEVEGDAVYVCALESSLPRGETLFEIFESTYAAFKDRVVAVQRRTTCTCNACRLIPSLDLKFISTCGNYYLQSIAGSTKPIGSDVNLVHRLAKNRVSESTGWHAYALFSEAALTHMALAKDGMHQQVETYEHLGDVNTYSMNLLARYEQMVAGRRHLITPEQADWTYTLEIPAPPSMVWDWLNDPYKRSLWGEHEIKALGDNRRRGVGTRNHCVHGKDNVRLQTILDWRPFEYFTMDDYPPGSDKPEMMMSHYLESIPDGTKLTATLQMQKPLPGAIRKPFVALMCKFLRIETSYRKMARMVTEEMNAQQVEPAAAAATNALMP